MQYATTPTLNIAYEAGGPADGLPALLLHGWPDDPRTYDRVLPGLHAAGFRTIVPYLRGFGGTTFLSKDTIRSGEMVAMAQDAIDLADALHLENFVVIGHDWGARIAYVLGTAVPQRVKRIVTMSVGWQPGELPTPSFKQAQAYWYQWYMTTERGRQTVRNHGKAFSRLQWENWSPTGWFTEEDFERTAASFENEDWPTITWHSYSARWGEANKDPSYADLERRAKSAQSISVPTLLIQGGSDAVTLPSSTEDKEKYFTGGYRRHLIPNVGHFPTREAPGVVAELASEFLKA